jgi:hypothetical protein
MPFIDFIISVDEPDVTDVINALSEQYEENIVDPNDPNGGLIPNPQTRAQFANETCRNWIAERVRLYRKRQAVEQIVVAEPILINPEVTP